MNRLLTLQNINKSFGREEVLRDLCLDVKRGEFLTLLGPSGCGKTTTIRIVAGLEKPDSGRVIMNGVDITDMPPEKRPVNTVFQNYALFPHMNVYKNIAYGLKARHEENENIDIAVKKALELVQLAGYERRRHNQLSGGQCQRVAIARAIVMRPDLLLLDEPLGALDLKLRRQMQAELKSIQKSLGGTFLYITHDQEEALALSDTVTVMNNGVILQSGTPREIYERPNSEFVAKFVGSCNLFDVEFKGGKYHLGQYVLPAAGGAESGRLKLLVRPEDMVVGEKGVLPCVVTDAQYTGGGFRLTLKAEMENAPDIIADSRDVYAAGDRVSIGWHEQSAWVIAGEEEA